MPEMTLSGHLIKVMTLTCMCVSHLRGPIKSHCFKRIVCIALPFCFVAVLYYLSKHLYNHVCVCMSAGEPSEGNWSDDGRGKDPLH